MERGEEQLITVRAVEPCALTGQLLGLTEEEARQAVVVLVGAERLEASVEGTSASFTVPTLPPGQWELHAATKNDRHAAVAEVACHDGEPLTVNLLFPEATEGR